MRHLLAVLAFAVSLFAGFVVFAGHGRFDAASFGFALLAVGIYGIPVLIAVYVYYVCFRARWAATLALAACSAAAFAGAHVAGERWMQWLALASVLTAAAFVHHLVLSVAGSFEKPRTERINCRG
jgi:hypothetical protein